MVGGARQTRLMHAISSNVRRHVQPVAHVCKSLCCCGWSFLNHAVADIYIFIYRPGHVGHGAANTA